MPILVKEVQEYLARMGSHDDPVLREMEEVARERHFPIVGPEVGRLLYQVARLTSARSIFEMGSGYGYSTYWFAMGAAPDAVIVHTDGDPANTKMAREYLARGGHAGKVRFATGDAREILASTPGIFDVVFMDIDKEQYPSAYEVFRERVRIGGAVVVDNLLWDGRVAAGDASPATRGILEYTRRMWADPLYRSSLLPVRDGVGLSIRVA